MVMIAFPLAGNISTENGVRPAFEIGEPHSELDAKKILQGVSVALLLVVLERIVRTNTRGLRELEKTQHTS
jgi:hypothetical protein